MKKIIKQLILYFLLFAIIKSILSYFISAPSTFNDSYHYIKLARSFFNYQDFSIHGNLFYSRPPLYPIVLSISYFFKDMTIIFLIMKIINSIISSLIIFPAWLLAKEFLSKRKALSLAILISLIPSNFAFAPHIMSENLFYPLFLFAIYFIYKSFIKNNYKYAILAGIFVALCYLTKIFSIILLALFIILSLVQFIRKKPQTNPLTFLLTFFIIILPWILKTTSGAPSKQASLLFTNIFSLPFYSQILLYFCYIILSTIIFFSLTSIFFFKNILKNEKYLLFGLIVIFTTLSMLLVGANHGGGTSIFEWLGARPIGRYIEMILPLIFITGFIGLYSYPKNKKDSLKKLTLIFIPLLFFSSLLAIFSLFPVNNMSLTWVGILEFVFQYIFKTKIIWLTLIFLTIVFLIILYISHILINNFSPKKIISIFIILFLSMSLLNYAVTYYNTEKYWYNSEQMQLGLWLNKYDKGKSLIIFDEKACTNFIEKLNQTSICEPTKTATIIGTWLNNDIIIRDINKLDIKKDTIIISRHPYNLPIIKKTESGIFVYKIDFL